MASTIAPPQEPLPRLELSEVTERDNVAVVIVHLPNQVGDGEERRNGECSAEEWCNVVPTPTADRLKSLTLVFTSEEEPAPRCIGTHSTYADGRPRTLCRGWLHGILSVSLLPAAHVTVVAGLALCVLPQRWILAEVLLTGKHASYLASSVFHLFPFKQVQAMRVAHKFDLILISLSMGVSPSPFIMELWEGLVSAVAHAAVVVLMVVLVLCRSAGRIPLLVLQYVLATLQVGVHLGFTSPIMLGIVVAYSLAFACYSQARHSKLVLPWHSSRLYGWHEDFHALLLLGDMLLIVAAARQLSDPRPHRRPSWGP